MRLGLENAPVVTEDRLTAGYRTLQYNKTRRTVLGDSPTLWGKEARLDYKSRGGGEQGYTKWKREDDNNTEDEPLGFGSGEWTVDLEFDFTSFFGLSCSCFKPRVMLINKNTANTLS